MGLRTIKTIHTVCWYLMACATTIIAYSVIVNQYPILFWICLGMIAAEVLVLVKNHWLCPLSKIARKYTSDKNANFDIYLPEFIARYNIRIFAIVGSLILLIYVIRRITS